MAETNVGVIFTAEDRASAVIAEVGKSVGGLQNKLKELEPTFKAMAVAGTAAFGAVSAVAVSSLREFTESQRTATIANVALENAMKGLENGGTIMRTISLGTAEVSSGLKLTGLEAESMRNRIASANNSITEGNMRLATLRETLSKGKITQAEYNLRVSQIQTSMDSARISIGQYNASLGETNKKKVELTKTVAQVVPSLAVVKQKMQETGAAALKLGFDDDNARLAFAKLFQVSQDVAMSQKNVKLAMDLSAFSGRSLEESTSALMKAYAGGTRVLKEFGIDVQDGATAQDVFRIASEKTAGAAVAASKTIEGQMRIANEAISNLKENIGAALAPQLAALLQKIQPLVEKTVAWAEANPVLIARILMAAAALSGLVAVAGILGLILPTIIAGFVALASPVALVVIGVGAAIATFIIFRERIAEMFQVLEAKTGLVTFLKESWDAVVEVFNTVLMPALRDLWDSLELLKPALIFLAQVLGVTLVAAAYAIVGILRVLIQVFASVISVGAEVVSFFINGLVANMNIVVNSIKSAVQWVETLISAFTRLNVVQGARSAVGNAVNTVGKFLNINDGIVQNGQIITTHPDDFIIATKTPETLGGGSRSINININGAIFSEDAARTLGNIIYTQLQMQMKN